MESTDQMGRKVSIPETGPKRIISLVPSQTELLYELGLGERVVGITDFCVHPSSWQNEKPKVGGTKLVLRKKVDALDPDLIIGNKEENTSRDIHRLEKKYPVWMSDIKTLEDAKSMIIEVGRITHTLDKAESITQQIDEKLASAAASQEQISPKIAYFIWRNPWMVVGKDTFIHNMCSKMGFQNVYEDKARYPETDLKDLKDRDPDFIFLSSEPFAFDESYKKEFESILPKEKVLVVDGQMFSWYGSRLIPGLDYITQLKNDLLKFTS